MIQMLPMAANLTGERLENPRKLTMVTKKMLTVKTRRMEMTIPTKKLTLKTLLPKLTSKLNLPRMDEELLCMHVKWSR